MAVFANTWIREKEHETLAFSERRVMTGSCNEPESICTFFKSLAPKRAFLELLFHFDLPLIGCLSCGASFQAEN